MCPRPSAQPGALAGLLARYGKTQVMAGPGLLPACLRLLGAGGHVWVAGLTLSGRAALGNSVSVVQLGDERHRGPIWDLTRGEQRLGPFLG